MIRAPRSLRGPGLALGLLAGLLALAEGGLRAFDLPRFDACRMGEEAPWAPDPEIGFVLAAEVQVGPGRTNAFGLRGPLPPGAKREGETRVLFIGDSTAWGLDVPLEASFAARSVELLAGEFPDREWIWLNGAVPGHSSFQSLAMLRRLLRYRPDLVVFYVGARNDAIRARYFADAEIPGRRARLETGWHEIRLLRLAEAARDRAFRSLLRKLRPKRAQARVLPEAFRENVRAMLGEARGAGAQALVLVPPTSPAQGEKYPALPEYRAILGELALEFGVPAVRLQEVFEAYPVDEVYREDAYHFREAGHEASARAIVRAVREQRLAERLGVSAASGAAPPGPGLLVRGPSTRRDP